jgi:acyl-CoA thioesterase I
MTLGFLLTACGGGGSSDPAPTAQAAPKPVLIEEYGDSTTVGLEVSNGVAVLKTVPEPAALQADLQALSPSVTVSNMGVSATEASQLLNGTDGVHAPWASQMSASKANIVTLNFALNDAYYTVALTAGIQSETPAQYAQIMTQLVQIAKAAGKTVVLYEPHPVCEPIREPILGGYVSALDQVAQSERIQIVAEYDYIQSLANWQDMLGDCLHPKGDTLYALKAQREANIVAPIVRTMQ